MKSLPEDLRSGFLRPEKNPSTSAEFEPANLGSQGEHVILRPQRPTFMDNRRLHKGKQYLMIAEVSGGDDEDEARLLVNVTASPRAVTLNTVSESRRRVE